MSTLQSRTTKRAKKLPWVKAIMLRQNEDTGRMLKSDPPVVKVFDRVSWERMVSVKRKDFNWEYIEHLPCRPGNDDTLSSEVTGGKEMSTFPKQQTSTDQNKQTV